jgi:hypothetical protein
LKTRAWQNWAIPTLFPVLGAAGSLLFSFVWSSIIVTPPNFVFNMAPRRIVSVFAKPTAGGSDASASAAGIAPDVLKSKSFQSVSDSDGSEQGSEAPEKQAKVEDEPTSVAVTAKACRFLMFPAAPRSNFHRNLCWLP